MGGLCDPACRLLVITGPGITLAMPGPPWREGPQCRFPGEVGSRPRSLVQAADGVTTSRCGFSPFHSASFPRIFESQAPPGTGEVRGTQMAPVLPQTMLTVHQLRPLYPKCLLSSLFSGSSAPRAPCVPAQSSDDD